MECKVERFLLLGSIVCKDMLRIDRFRWAACQLDALENCLTYRSIQEVLAPIPTTLDETYSRILRSIPDKDKPYATRLLQFLTYSERPIKIKEAVDAIAVVVNGDQYFNPKDRMPDPQEISYYCSNLVVVVPTKTNSYDQDDEYMELQLAHFSVKEYLTSNRLDKDIAKNFQEVAAKTSIAIVCLAYLLHLDQDLPIQEIKENFPLAQYSARYWMINATVAERGSDMLQDLIVEFFCSHQKSYKTCYSLYRPDQPWYDESD